MGTWTGGKEKAPAAICRKVAEALMDDEIEVWGDGLQTRSFLYIDECIEMILRFMRQDNFLGPVNIGSEEMVTINQLAEMTIRVANKRAHVKNINGKEFKAKYGFKCPVGVRGRNSDNKLYKEKIGWEPTQSLIEGIRKTYQWINKQINK
jgi:nucleoside-diphosphate-sugar epimerase